MISRIWLAKFRIMLTLSNGFSWSDSMKLSAMHDA